MLSSLGWTEKEQVEVLENMTFEDIQHFGGKLFENLCMELYVWGNANIQLATRMLEIALDYLPPNTKLTSSVITQQAILGN